MAPLARPLVMAARNAGVGLAIRIHAAALQTAMRASAVGWRCDMRAPFYSASRSLVGTAVALSVANAVAASAQTQTVVTLGFDDDTAEQSQVGAMLASRGLNATFFVNSGRVGT